jgi:uncharacterized protein YbjQ (UPF0145 family)
MPAPGSAFIRRRNARLAGGRGHSGQALYDARELAMCRMPAEAARLEAEGIVGVRLKNAAHTWGEHTTEFFAIGTAIRPLRDDHIIAKPTMVLSLNDLR